MAVVTLTVGGRRYELACRDGEEARLRELAALVDVKTVEAARALGPTNEARQLFFAALLLADDLTEARRAPSPEPVPGEDPTEGLAEALETLAARIERLAETLEKDAPAT